MQFKAVKFLALATWAMILSGAPAHADWTFEGGEEASVHVARVCKGGDQELCLELGCETGESLSFRLTSRNFPDMVAAPRLDTLLFVGSQLAGSLEFSHSGLESFQAPLEETHLRGIDRLKAGVRAQLHVWYSNDSAPEIHRFTLIGSNKAITEVQQFCPLPDFAARELERRTLEDPAARIMADMREACAVLNGKITEGTGFSEPFDIDGKPPMDLRVNHGALVCDSTPDLVCGPAGCLTSLWVAQEEGRYRRVFLNAIQDVVPGEAGQVKLRYKGSRCGAKDALCEQAFALDAEELVAQGDVIRLPDPEPQDNADPAD
ncbi:hypothetical protein [Antarctobacter jejuensis]|uniref:hypothetical protein n=1 Tax=Antarctobacter jejuensis TaxID=1439938 RepID=UPI003FD30545